MDQVMRPISFQRPAFLSFLQVPAGRVVATPDFASKIGESGRIAVMCDLKRGDQLGPLIDGASAIQRGFMVMAASDELEGKRIASKLSTLISVEN